MKKKAHYPFVQILCITGVLFSACTTGQTGFTITNPLDLERIDEPVILTRGQIIEKYGVSQIEAGKLPLPYFGNTMIPAQVDDIDMDGEWDELAFVLDFQPYESQRITINFSEPNDYPKFEARTNIRFGILDENVINPLEKLSIAAHEVPPPPFSRFQMDGPAWENDKVGFRHYIDGRNARDVFGKKSSEMALDTVGISSEGTLEDNYHVMLPWGRDILSVGYSLGIGGLAVMRNSEPVRLGVRMEDEMNNVDTTTYQLIKEGPVRTIFRLTYEGWDTGYDSVTLVNDVTIWAGHYSHTNEIQVLESGVSSDTLLVGLVNIHNDKPEKLFEYPESGYSALLTHDRQTYDKEWYLGMALIFPNKNYIRYFEAPESGQGIINSFLVEFELSGEKKLMYSVLAGWELADEQFADPTYFSGFVSEYLLKKSSPLLIH